MFDVFSAKILTKRTRFVRMKYVSKYISLFNMKICNMDITNYIFEKKLIYLIIIYYLNFLLYC